MLKNRTIARLLDRNVKAVAKIEAALVGQRSAGAHFVRWLIRCVGTPTSALIHAAALVVWIGINIGPVPAAWRFDPPPFAMLQLVASIEAILLGVLILTS